MKLFSWFVLVLVVAVTVTISFSQNPPPRGNAPENAVGSTGGAPATQENKAALKTPVETTWAPRHSFDYPSVPAGLPAHLPSPRPLDKYVLLAWNDLGMHCYQADFATFQILPPYNVFWTQVIRRGQKPAVVTEGVELRYETLKVTDPVRHTNVMKTRTCCSGPRRVNPSSAVPAMPIRRWASWRTRIVN